MCAAAVEMQQFSDICGQNLRFGKLQPLRLKVTVWICIIKLQDLVIVLLVQMYSTDPRKTDITVWYIHTNLLICGQCSDNTKVKYSTRICADSIV